MIAVDITSTLKQKNNIAIVSHMMPDGDSVGSMLALFNVLKRMGKSVDIYSSDKIPAVYSFLPNCKLIKQCNEILNKEYEVIVVLDCGSMDRTGNCSVLEKLSDICINIDHHGTNTLFADLNLVDTNASATGELIYQIIKLMGQDILEDEAICLYTAILTDTGGFRYSNTTSITHQIAGDLINTGIDFGKVYERIYKSYKYENIKVMGKVLSTIELSGDGSIAFISLLKKDLEDLVIESINTSDFIDYARDIDSVEAAAFVKEIDTDEFKVSFRSKRIIDVKKICEKYGGGGHVRAAGCTIKGDLQFIKQLVINDLKNALRDELN